MKICGLLACLALTAAGAGAPGTGSAASADAALAPSERTAQQRGLVDANTATEVELDAIAGIGPALAARIIEARRARPFADAEDLRRRVKGIGAGNLKRMLAAGLSVRGAHSASEAGRSSSVTSVPGAGRVQSFSGGRAGSGGSGTAGVGAAPQWIVGGPGGSRTMQTR